MVDPERVDRLLTRVLEDLRQLSRYAALGPRLLEDGTALAAAKYYFITAIQGCSRAAQHIVAAEGWPVPETNADAIRLLQGHGVVPAPVAEAVARAVGFRNLLVHEYATIDDERVVANLGRIDDLERFVGAVAAWLRREATD